MLLFIHRVLSLWLLVFSIARTSASAVPTSPSSYGPDLNAARRNAFQIFNAVHSAMRQWGSSVNHNGLSFFFVIIPEGNLLYHGHPFSGRPDSFDWLAFEVEHAYAFALPWIRPPLPPDSRPDILSWHPSNIQSSETQMSKMHEPQYLDSNNQHRFVATPDSGDNDCDDEEKLKPPPDGPFRGYFQTYRAERPLKLIYIDGMGAAKGAWGTCDSQDLLLEGVDRNSTNGPNVGDMLYGRMLCKLAKEWEIDGWIRMESGFEIIYCDFGPGAGLELVSQHGSALPNETTHWHSEVVTLIFEFIRAASQRYQGMSSGRIQVDWSSMVSAFAYDVNITNPDLERQDLPRLVGVTKEEKMAIRARLGAVVAARKHGAKPEVDWQSVVDQLITRFSDRLNLITHGNLSAEVLWGEVRTLINPFLDFSADKNASEPTTASVTLCTRHHLEAAILVKDSWTPEDAAIYVAVETVADRICSSLFQIRTILDSTRIGVDDVESALLKSREIAVALTEQLQWTAWKQCGRCVNSEQFCFIPMFPAGNLEDYYHPSCKGLADLDEMLKGCYWKWWKCTASPTSTAPG